MIHSVVRHAWLTINSRNTYSRTWQSQHASLSSESRLTHDASLSWGASRSWRPIRTLTEKHKSSEWRLAIEICQDVFELLPASYRRTILSRVSLLSSAARWARRSNLSLTSRGSILPSNPTGALLSWSADGPVCPDSTLSITHDFPSVQTVYVMISQQAWDSNCDESHWE